MPTGGANVFEPDSDQNGKSTATAEKVTTSSKGNVVGQKVDHMQNNSSMTGRVHG